MQTPHHYESLPVDNHIMGDSPLQKVKRYTCSSKCAELAGCIVIGIVLLGIPELCVPLFQRPVPYQTTNDNDIILDFTKNQEWTDESFSSKCHHCI